MYVQFLSVWLSECQFVRICVSGGLSGFFVVSLYVGICVWMYGCVSGYLDSCMDIAVDISVCLYVYLYVLVSGWPDVPLDTLMS